QLLAQIGRRVDENRRAVMLDEQRAAAAPVLRLRGIAGAPIIADERHPAGAAAAEDADFHAASGRRALSNRRKKFSVVRAASAASGSPRSSASSAAVWTT